MKKYCAALVAAGAMALAGAASAQVTIIDDFEAGIGDWTFQGNAGEAISQAADGADGTNFSLQLDNGGFSFWAQNEYPAGTAPVDGNYRFSFWWKNGVDSNPAHRNAVIQVDPNGGTDNLEPIANLSGAPDPAPIISDWTFVESSPIGLTAANPFTFRFFSNGGNYTPTARLDQIGIEELAALPIALRVTPISGNYVAGTVNIVVEATGGSESFTQAEFDVENNSTVDFTDSTAGTSFTFPFDTTTLSDGPVEIAVTVTDTNDDELTVVVSYTIANDEGREVLFSSDFEDFVSGIPTGWNRVDINGDGVSGQGGEPGVVTADTTNPFGGTGTSLRIDYAAQPDPTRYTLMTDSFAANRNDYTLSAALRGSSFSRLYFFISTDDGVTFTNTFQGIDSGVSSVWAELIDYTAAFSQDPDDQIAVATHMFGAGTSTIVVDNVIVSASIALNEPEPDPTSVQYWDMY